MAPSTVPPAPVPTAPVPTAPQLREELEVITGMDDMTLIFDPVTGVYHRVSRSGQLVLTHLDGHRTSDELAGLLTRDRAAQDSLAPQLEAFLTHLASSGLLVGSTVPEHGTRDRRVRTSRLMPRVIVTRSLPTLLEPVAARLRTTRLGLLCAIALLLALTGYAAGVSTLLSQGMPSFATVGWSFAVAAALQLVLILVHESAHALVAQVQEVPVRGLGFAMLFWFMPVAYVDRTDAYRLRGRGGRVAIALAGMTSDGVFCGISAVLVLSTDGFWQQTFILLLAIQMLGLLINVNPLLPSDGYSALEAGTGLVDFRGRSFALVTSRLRGRALPTHLTSLSWRARLAYGSYALASTAYITLAAVLVVSGTVHSVTLAVEAASR